MESNENQSLPTLDNQIIELNNDADAVVPTLDQQITINEPNEKPAQKIEDNSQSTPIKGNIEQEQEKK